MKTRHFLLGLSILSICFKPNAHAQIDINANNFAYQQNFNGLGQADNAWVDDTTIPDWYAVNENGTINAYRVTNSGTAALYSFGTNSDRALGSLAAGSTGDIIFGARFQNNSGQPIQSIQLSFKVEQWRRALTDITGHQRIKVSYAIANAIDVSHPALYNNNSFIDLPEAYLITLDTIRTADVTLPGNSTSSVVNVTFPVSIPNGWQFFLRFKDENEDSYDASLAVDNLTITFSHSSVSKITANSLGYAVFPYLDMGIVHDIPDKNNSPAYTAPTPAQVNDWQEILETFYTSDDIADVDASAYGYVAVEYEDKDQRIYHVLRKQNSSPYFWGTYVKLPAADNNKLLIQTPHASDDLKTGTQSAAVFYLTLAKGLMLSGTSRCAGNSPACTGVTSVCSDNDTNLPFRKSDVAHEVNSIFHLATTILADLYPTMVFVQLHGFAPPAIPQLTDPEFIISCGSINAELKSVPDYPVLVRENLLDTHPLLDIKITHVDDYSELGAQNNVQGRYLNLYSHDICADAFEPEGVTNRFLHIEQYLGYRKVPTYYSAMANALSEVINDNSYIKSISIANNMFYNEQFTSLTYPGISHTWGNNLHVSGWYAAATKNDLFSIFHIAHGQLNDGGIYSFGENSSSDRALGSIATSSSSSAGDIAYGVLFKNDTGVPLYGVELDYNSEQWRNSIENGVQTVELGYRIDDEIELFPLALLDDNSFIHVPAGDLNSSNVGNINPEMDGTMNSTNILVTIPFVLNPDEELFIRFFDTDNTGFDKAMAVDDFNAHFLTEPPMPVDWLYFNVTKKNGRPLLQWGADKETECKNYEILRSDDGKDFESIATLSCHGQALNNTYEYIDFLPIWNRNVYYKLAQYDNTGEVTYSPLKSFNSNSSTKPEVYFKNGELVIETNKESKLLSVGVFDFMGRQFCQGTPTSESDSRYTLDCPNAANQLVIVQLIFDSGNYVVHMKTGN